jgi:hypothetical protein
MKHTLVWRSRSIGGDAGGWIRDAGVEVVSGIRTDISLGALDLLFEHSEEIEKKVFFQTANLFNLKVDLIPCDTTTASFSVDREDEDDRKLGPAKKGFWAPQVVVALAVTPEGFPVKSWVLPGNTAMGARWRGCAPI